MITFQGWAIIRESFNEGDESEALRKSIQEELEKKVMLLDETNESLFLKLGYFNGELKLLIAGASNHKTAPWFEVLKLYKWLSQNAIGSYGLLHFHDDEDQQGLSNSFQVYSLKKGILEHGIDPFLSPVVPEVEVL